MEEVGPRHLRTEGRWSWSWSWNWNWNWNWRTEEEGQRSVGTCRITQSSPVPCSCCSCFALPCSSASPAPLLYPHTPYPSPSQPIPSPCSLPAHSVLRWSHALSSPPVHLAALQAPSSLLSQSPPSLSLTSPIHTLITYALLLRALALSSLPPSLSYTTTSPQSPVASWSWPSFCFSPLASIDSDCPEEAALQRRQLRSIYHLVVPRLLVQFSFQPPQSTAGKNRLHA